MTTDPAAQAALRVPRSYVDGLYVRGEQGPASRVGAGVVVSVDGYNTCTVVINDEEVTGVVWLGTVAPRVDDVVEVEMRGDLLVIPAINDLDTFLEGMEDQAEHIVSDTDPGAPPPVDLQVGGSMRGLDAWQFFDSRTNALVNPSFEVDTTGWSTVRCAMTRTASGTAQSGGYVARLTNNGAAATHYLDTPAASRYLVAEGQVVTFSAYVRLVTGGGLGYHAELAFQNAAGATVGSWILGAAVTLTTAWQRISVTATVPTGTGIVSVGPVITSANTASADVWEVDACMLDDSPAVGAYIEGSIYGTPALNWARELGPSGQGMRVYQTGPPTVVARNMVTIPSGDAGVGPNAAGHSWTAGDTQTGTYSGTALVESSPEIAYTGAVSLKATWLPDPKPSSMTLRVGGHTIGQQYTAKAFVYVPAGGQDARLIVQGVTASAAVTVKGAWTPVTLTYTATAAEHVIGVATPAATATLAGTAYLDAVSVVAGATALTPYFDGSTSSSATEKYVWTGTPHLSTSEHWTGPTPPTTPPAAAPPGVSATLWSEEFVDVDPGDTIGFDAAFLELAGAPTAQLVVSYCSADGAYPPPGDPTTATVAMGAAVKISGAADIVLGRTTVVPETVTFPGPGAQEPKTARLGIKFTGNLPGTAQALALKTTATLTAKGWPLGSLWMDPDAPVGGLPTIVDNGESLNVNSNDLPSATADTPIPGAKRAIVTAPATTGGVAIVTFYGSIAFRSANSYLTLKLLGTPGGILTVIQAALAATITATIPFSMRAVIPLSAGEEVTVTPVYAYSGTAITTPHAVLRPGMTVEFYPGAVASGGSSDPMIRYWDGDSWRPEMLRAATVDLSQLATTTPVPKTNTTTTLARSASSIHEGSTLTLTSTTTAGAAGTVTFYRATSTSGPWTSLGSATISATKAVKTWTAAPGAWYFRATYGGSSLYNGSTSAATPVTTVLARVTKTLVIPCSWAQSYAGNGAKLSGTSADDAVHQGWASAAHGNRRALLRFVNTGIPAAAEVTSVSLVCKTGGWDYWENAAAPVLIVGSFNNTPNVPATFPPSNNVFPDRSRIDIPAGLVSGGPGGFSANVTSWAKVSVTASIFSGLLIGPGPSDSPTWRGYSSEPGKDQFTLKVIYDVWE
jgi:hypothetical protein